MNVLLVEDEARVADFLRRGFKGEGWSVTHAADGETALERLADEAFDIVVLDLMLPGITGQDVCRKVRARGIHTPVLMLTALDSVDERIEGLRIGADDYLTKPFDFDELIARVQALHRRETDFRGAPASRTLSYGEIAFNRDSLVLTVGGEPMDLTAKERELMLLLLANPERLLTRERILNAVWGLVSDPLTNTVDVYIARLRKKLGEPGLMIQTVRGLGYSLMA